MPMSDQCWAPGHDALFAPGLLDPAKARPAGVTGPFGKGADKRYNVYRNNVTVSLIDALADIYPAVRRVTGETFFRETARAFVRAHPPSSPLLFLYGEGFDRFLAGFEPAGSLPYLPDLATAERRWLTAYHAADAVPLAGEALGAVSPDRLGDVRFVMHPAFALVRSRFSVFRIFAMNRDLEPLGPIDTTEPEAILVTRPQLDVLVRSLPAPMAAFIETAAAGGTLEDAAGAGLALDAGFDISAAITTLIISGAATALEL